MKELVEQEARLRKELGFRVDLEGGPDLGWCYSDEPYACRPATAQEHSAWKKIISLESELAQLRDENERLSASVSDEEYGKHFKIETTDAYLADCDSVDALIAARAAKKEQQG